MLGLSLNRNQSFIVGNLIGITILVAGILLTAPQKIKEQRELEEKAKQTIVVATRSIKKGESLQTDNVAEQKIERKEVALNSVESLKKALQMVARNDIREGAHITYADVVPKGAPPEGALPKDAPPQ